MKTIKIKVSALSFVIVKTYLMMYRQKERKPNYAIEHESKPTDVVVGVMHTKKDKLTARCRSTKKCKPYPRGPGLQIK